MNIRLTLAAMVLVLLAGVACSGKAAYKGSGLVVLNPPINPPNISLVDQNGKPFQLSDAQGKVVVLTFLYTHCTDVCPILGVKLADAMKLLGKDLSKIEFVGITIDPLGRDTVDRVKTWSQDEGLESYSQWHFLTGSLDVVQPIWKVYYVQGVSTGQPADVPTDATLKSEGLYNGLNQAAIATADSVRQTMGGDIEISHPTPVFILDKTGKARIELNATVDPADMAYDIRLMLKQ